MKRLAQLLVVVAAIVWVGKPWILGVPLKFAFQYTGTYPDLFEVCVDADCQGVSPERMQIEKDGETSLFTMPIRLTPGVHQLTTRACTGGVCSALQVLPEVLVKPTWVVW